MSGLRLFVQEGPGRRVFRLGEGVLVIGSGEEARLRLSSPEVAARHVRLEVAEGRARLFLEPGVLPLEVDGVTMARDAARLAPGSRVRIGGALLWIEADSTPLPRDRGGSTARQAAPAVQRSATPGPRVSTVARRQRRRRKGLPGWALSGMAVAALGALLLVRRGLLFSAEQARPDAGARIAAARALLDRGRLDDALARLELAGGAEWSPSERKQVEALRAEVASLRAASEEAVKNREGSPQLQWLQRYAEEFLAGSPDIPRVRLFLKRARGFREEYPHHPSLGWVERQESRFAGLVDLDRDPDWASVKWEARSLVRGLPRNYRGAVACIDEFLARTPAGDDHDRAERFRMLLADERAEYYEERMRFASELYRQGQVGRAVWWLVHQVIWSGEPDIADEAARVLIKLPDAYDHLLGYRTGEPERFGLLMENTIVFKFFHAKENDPH